MAYDNSIDGYIRDASLQYYAFILPRTVKRVVRVFTPAQDKPTKLTEGGISFGYDRDALAHFTIGDDGSIAMKLTEMDGTTEIEYHNAYRRDGDLDESAN